MNNKFKNFIFILTVLSSLGLILSAAYFSISGLSKTFAGASSEVRIMGTALEFSKVVISVYIHFFWSKMKGFLKYWLSFSLLVLVIITSLGIYGFLSNAFKETEAQFNASNKKIELIEFKKENFNTRVSQLEERISQYNDQIQTINSSKKSISSALQNTSDYYEYIDKETGEKVRRARSNANKQILLDQLNSSDEQINKIQNNITNLYDKIETQRDSILKLDQKIMEENLNNDAAGELGPLIYVSEVTGFKMSLVINFFMLVIVVVFDPLAISLVFAASYAFMYNENQNSVDLDMVDEHDQQIDQKEDIEIDPVSKEHVRDYYKNVLLSKYQEKPKRNYKKRNRKEDPESEADSLKEENHEKENSEEQEPEKNTIKGKKK